jgi:opacity protein-like surface antigen
MKKEIVSSLVVATLVTSLQAGGDIGGVVSFQNPDAGVKVEEVKKEIKVEPKVEEPKVEPKVEEKSDKGFYAVVKGLSVMGDSVDTLDADSGFGVGLDLGYRFGNGLAAEADFSFAKSDLNKPTTNEASYKTAALSLVYTLPVTDKVGIFAKAGYMQEQTKVKALDVDETESGLVYGGGLEYKINDTYGVVAEYEGSAIDDSIRGDAISLGIMYNF